MAKKCVHIDQTRAVTPRTNGCEACLMTGDEWEHLAFCLTCGHVGCCNVLMNGHAMAHFDSTRHPMIESLHPAEGWRWCYVDEILIVDELSEESQNVMPDSIRSSISSKDGTPVVRQVLPLASDTLASSRSGGRFKSIRQRVLQSNRINLAPIIELAVEIAREGREGRHIGTLFTFGDSDGVLAHSRPLILDPLAGHSERSREIRDPNLRGTIKELAQLDGAFVVSEQGIVVSACRYLDAMASDVVLPFGMASRHLAGASISQLTGALAIVVSASSIVRLFDDGKLVAEIIPELWVMDLYNNGELNALLTVLG
jgi:diadenylate cyclase